MLYIVICVVEVSVKLVVVVLYSVVMGGGFEFVFGVYYCVVVLGV